MAEEVLFSSLEEPAAGRTVRRSMYALGPDLFASIIRWLSASALRSVKLPHAVEEDCVVSALRRVDELLVVRSD